VTKTEWAVVAGVVLLVMGGGGAAMAFAIKPGVSGELRPEMDPVLAVVPTIWRMHGLGAPTITSIQDGQHRPDSFHYRGLAIDFRLRDVPAELHETLRSEVAAALGSNFDVLHEYHGTTSDHLHVEYDV
jgi:hypothetical protein